MASEWRTTTLDQLGRIVTGKTPPSTVVDAFGGHIPFVTPSDMNGVRIISTTARALSACGQAAVKNAVIPKDAVMVSCIGSDMGKAAIAGTDCVTNQQINSIIVDTDDSSLFVYYNLSTRKAEIRGSASGSAQPILNKSAFGRLEIELPPPQEQTEIAETLGTLDDRVDNLRHTNATLQAIAAALFKSHFVDFDGVPPEEMQESELGLIPKGWRVGTLGDVLSLRNERMQSSKETAALPYVPIESIGAKNPFLSDWMGGENANSSLILFKRGDILFGAMRPYFHKVCIAPFDGVTRTTVFTLKPTKPEFSAYALMLAYQDETIEWATSHSEGSTIPYAKWKNSFERMPVVLPPEDVRIRFGEIVSPLIEKANANIQQATTLANLRDALLPRLISGQLRVSQ